MGKLRKTLLIFIVILVQSALAVTAGFAAIAFSAGDTLPPGIYAGDTGIGGMGRLEASKAIEDDYKAIFSSDSLKLTIADKEYTIAFADFDVRVDGESTVKLMDDWRSKAYISTLIRAYFNFTGDRIAISPVIKYNEGRLRQKLIELSGRINQAPVNASISLENGKVIKKAETSGYELDIAAAAEAIGKHLSGDFKSPMVIAGKSNSIVKAVAAEVRLKEFSDIEQIISQYTTQITDGELASSIRLAADAVNGIVLAASGEDGSEFSFVDVLRNADKSFQNDNEGYDQVASTLYAALLGAGIDKGAITRLAHTLAVEYIEPGLDAWISGNGGDLKFKNTFPHKIALFAGIEGDRLTISLAGSLLDEVGAYELRTEIMQKFSPPVVYIENKDLKHGEKIMLSPGKEGLLVHVFRNDEIISEDRYEPEKSMFQVGPGTRLSNEDEK